MTCVSSYPVRCDLVQIRRPRSLVRRRLRPRHVPVPQRRRASCRASRRVHRDRHPLPIQADARVQRPPPDRLGRLRAPRRAVCDQEQRPPPRHDPEERRQLPPPDQVAGLLLRLGPRGRHHRPRLLPVDPVDLPPSSSTPGTTPIMPWVDPQGHAARGRGRPIAELPIPEGRIDPTPIATPAAGLPRRGPGQLVPRAGDRPGQRGGDRRQVRASAATRRPDAAPQWMLRITAYADRLVDDLDLVDWPRAIREMQRNWIGRSEGAEVDFSSATLAAWRTRPRPSSAGPTEGAPRPDVIRVFTTRPTPSSARPTWSSPPSIRWSIPHHPRAAADRASTPIATGGRLARATSTGPTWPRTKTGVFTGGLRDQPGQRPRGPVWIADYVLMGYGTGAIMAVPGHDERDFEFAQAFACRSIRVVAPSIDRASEIPLDEAEADLRRRRQFAQRPDRAGRSRRPAHRPRPRRR